uniref:Uncharacterized protein n=1 Tax=Octopus bimaculoides TaxID=37653 RepID=A0A0L8IBF0_OCTBM
MTICTSLIMSRSSGSGHHSHVSRGILWGLNNSPLETWVFSSSLNKPYSRTF